MVSTNLLDTVPVGKVPVLVPVITSTSMVNGINDNTDTVSEPLNNCHNSTLNVVTPNSKLKVIAINCQSILNKIAHFHTYIEFEPRH
jgi:hypothetical protein